jgi:hypothetical protein
VQLNRVGADVGREVEELAVSRVFAEDSRTGICGLKQTSTDGWSDQ